MKKPSHYRLPSSNDDMCQWRHYLLETVDYAEVSVCRILASRRSHSNLLQYEPARLGGPWYWDVNNDCHYCLQSIMGYDGRERRLVVEIVRESDVIGVSKPGPDWSVVQDIGKYSDEFSAKCSFS